MELAQLVRDRSVALRVAEPDRRRDVERALAPRLPAHPAPRRRWRTDEVAEEQVDLDGVAGMRQMAGALEDRERPVRQLGEPCAGGAGAYGVVAAVDHEDRTVDPGEERAHALLVREPRCQLSRDQRLGVGLETPTNGVLALLGRVRLREALREEELEEVLVVLDPVVTVPLPPVGVVLARLVELAHRLQPRGRRWQRERRGDEHHPVDPPRVFRREQQRPFRAPRQRYEDRALGRGCVHHRDRVRGELLLTVGVGLGRPIGAAVPTSVEGEHAAVPREVGDLHLPVARMDDRPGRHEQDRRLAFPCHRPRRRSVRRPARRIPPRPDSARVSVRGACL